MQTILADRTISASEFRKNPNKALEDSEGRPVAVLKNNEPSYYVVPPDLFEGLADLMDDLSLAKTVRERLANPDFIDVDLDEL